MTDLVVAPCTYKAAKYACENWHYSKKIPLGRIIYHGVWESSDYIGCLIYSLGANNNMAKKYKMKVGEVCELSRIALKEHRSFVTQIIKKSVQLLKKSCILIKLIISFADSNRKHLGKIYQASNWIYSGLGNSASYFIVCGKKYHHRAIRHKNWKPSEKWLKLNIDKNSQELKQTSKYRYLMPLDKAMRRQIEPLALPYPKNLAEVV